MLNIREIVTAILGIATVVFTLALTGLAFSMAGDGPQMRDAITVLTLLFGLAGVAVGYYFGRVPAEARAVEAQKRADTANDAMDTASKAMDAANQDKRTIINQAAAIHDGMEDKMDKAGLTPSMLENLTIDSITPHQWDQIMAILTSVDAGISGITKTLPPSERSNLQAFPAWANPELRLFWNTSRSPALVA